MGGALPPAGLLEARADRAAAERQRPVHLDPQPAGRLAFGPLALSTARETLLPSAPPPSLAAPDSDADSEVSPPKPKESFAARPEPQPEPLPKSWTAHNDAAGFAVNLPPAWTVGKVSASGQIIFRGAHGEEIVIWPLHLQQPELDSQGAAALVQEFARKFDVLMPWSAVQTMPNAARVMGLGEERSATAVVS